MHTHTYECEDCGEEYEVVSEQDEGFAPGHFLFCDYCSCIRFFFLSEHIEIQNYRF